MTIKNNPKYTIFCLGMLLFVLLLPCFKGRLYLSANGYLLLKHTIGGPLPGSSVYSYSESMVTFEMIVNGDRVYWMTSFAFGPTPATDGYYTESLFLLSQHYGMTELHIWRNVDIFFKTVSEPTKKLNYRIADNVYLKNGAEQPRQYQKNIDLIAEFTGSSYWKPAGYRVVEGYATINEGRGKMAFLSAVLLVLLQGISLRLLTVRWSNNQKYSSIKRAICCSVFGLLQLFVLWMDLLKYIIFL